MLNTAIALIVYKRLDTTKRVFKIINLARPQKLYIIADGPKTKQEEIATKLVRNFLEENIDWECNVTKIYSSTNLGCAKRVSTGLNEVFSKEEKAIILEDDTLPDISFFKYCEELLELYENNHQVFHISGCNEYPKAFNTNESYCFSSIINIWGWATWSRAWRSFDLNMSSWEKQNKQDFLKNWCSSRREMDGKKKMFDLHCNNPDPWTWDYQWVYSCWKNNGLAITPRVNLVSNIGIGPDATNTSSNQVVPLYPKELECINIPLSHTQLKRDRAFEKKYQKASRPKSFRRIKNLIKKFVSD